MASSWGRNEEVHELEGRIEFATAKAFLVEPTIGEQCWIPKSQIVEQSEPDADGNVIFKVTHWWWGKQGFNE